MSFRKEDESSKASDEKQQTGAVKLDTILTEEVGQFGRYQLTILLLATLPIISNAFLNGEYIFTTARINTRCRIPACDGPASEVPMPEFRPQWVLNAISGTSQDSFEACSRFPDQPPQLPANDTCPAAWFDRSREVHCDEYVYEHTNTVVYDFQMACQEWKRSQIGSFRVVGAFLAKPLAGYISDRWGRRVALTVTAVHGAWTGVVRSFLSSYEWYLVSIIVSNLAAGLYGTVYILATELVGPQYRVKIGTSISILFALSNVLLGLVAWCVHPWRQLTQALYVPQLISVVYFWMFPESIRWLMSKGRYDEAEAILKKMARINNMEVSDKSLNSFRAGADADKLKDKPKEPLLAILVLKPRAMRCRCVVGSMWWITNTVVYYGLSINAVNLSGNSYLNYVYVSAVEIPGFWVSGMLLDRVGRKPVLMFGYFLCAVSQFIFPMLPADMWSVSMAMFLLGKFSISMTVASIYVYTAELFPTKHRHNLFNFCSMMGRIGAFIAPLTPSLAQEVWEPLPSVLFGCLSLLSGLLFFFTPETTGTKLPDTMQEAEDLGAR